MLSLSKALAIKMCACLRRGYLLGLAVLADANVGQQLPLQDFACVLDSGGLCHADGGSTLAYEIQSHLQTKLAAVAPPDFAYGMERETSLPLMQMFG
jgi:hypothetical protein